jgi:carbamoyl-phosphate synthase large subunit
VVESVREILPLKIFVRQGFTESGPGEVALVQGVLDVLGAVEAGGSTPHLLTGQLALGPVDFHEHFERTTGLAFTPRGFREHRLGLLDVADAVVVIRTGLSESGAFEVAYNVFGRRVPMFFAVWAEAPIKTTLLRDLDDLVPSEYVTFQRPEELAAPLREFFDSVVQAR